MPKGAVNMIIMRVKADNMLCFNNFDINMSYPKKIVNSPVANEYLTERTNFRYKKVNILMGGNATGKTSLGRLLMMFMNYFKDGAQARFSDMITDYSKSAYLSVDFVTKDLRLFRFEFAAGPGKDNGYDDSNVDISIKSVRINKMDSYETCEERLDNNIKCKYETYNQIDTEGWNFTFPRDITGNTPYALIGKSSRYLTVLEKVLKTLDPAIRGVDALKDVDNSFVIRFDNRDTIIQDGVIANEAILSSGTKAGIDIAYIIASSICNMHDFYYCDEIFSFVNSDLEKACLSVIIEKLGDDRQLFYTTHNSDILDMDLPKHSYTFLKKEVREDSVDICCVYASDYLKKAEDSMKNAVENDLFCIAPELNELYDLIDLD